MCYLWKSWTQFCHFFCFYNFPHCRHCRHRIYEWDMRVQTFDWQKQLQFHFTTLYLFLPTSVNVESATKKIKKTNSYLTFILLVSIGKPGRVQTVCWPSFGWTALFVRLHNWPKTMTNKFNDGGILALTSSDLHAVSVAVSELCPETQTVHTLDSTLMLHAPLSLCRLRDKQLGLCFFFLLNTTSTTPSRKSRVRPQDINSIEYRREN